MRDKIIHLIWNLHCSFVSSQDKINTLKTQLFFYYQIYFRAIQRKAKDYLKLDYTYLQFYNTIYAKVTSTYYVVATVVAEYWVLAGYTMD